MVSFEKLIGKKVVNSTGYILGEVKNADFDDKTWRIGVLHVKLADVAAEELGFKKRFRKSMVCLPVRLVIAVADVVTVRGSLKELSESKEITECKE